MSAIAGQTAFVTGASRGIGEATARVLAGAGVAVTLAARSGNDIERIADEIRDGGGRALAIACDVADRLAVEAAIAEAEAAHGPLDILVNNAGMIEPIGPLASTDPDDWAQTIDVNVKGVYFGLRAVLPGMMERGRGTIINISSGAASNALEGWSAYCTSKAAAAMLTRAADLEARAPGVRVIGLSPGTVATDMQRVIKASGINRVSELDWSVHIPADWPARAIAWLAGPDGDAFAGQEVSLRDETIRRRVGLIE
ncbi:MAG: SDR family oxidoreductase [Pseudomonadota bacterium]